MGKYMLPLPGENDPAATIRHYAGTRIRGAVIAMRRGVTPRLDSVRGILSELLEGYADGTYTYVPTGSFNPKVAIRLKSRVARTIRDETTIEDLQGLTEHLFEAMESHESALSKK